MGLGHDRDRRGQQATAALRRRGIHHPRAGWQDRNGGLQARSRCRWMRRSTRTAPAPVWPLRRAARSSRCQTRLQSSDSRCSQLPHARQQPQPAHATARPGRDRIEPVQGPAGRVQRTGRGACAGACCLRGGRAAHVHLYEAQKRVAEHLEQALESRGASTRPRGFLMVQRRCSKDAAFPLLVEAAQRANHTLRQTAERVIADLTKAPSPDDVDPVAT